MAQSLTPCQQHGFPTKRWPNSMLHVMLRVHFHVRSRFGSPFCILLALASSVALVLLAVYVALAACAASRCDRELVAAVALAASWNTDAPSLRSACRSWGKGTKSPSKGPPALLDGSIHQRGFGDCWEWHIYAAGAKRDVRLRSLG